MSDVIYPYAALLNIYFTPATSVYSAMTPAEQSNHNSLVNQAKVINTTMQQGQSSTNPIQKAFNDYLDKVSDWTSPNSTTGSQEPYNCLVAYIHVAFPKCQSLRSPYVTGQDLAESLKNTISAAAQSSSPMTKIWPSMCNLNVWLTDTSPLMSDSTIPDEIQSLSKEMSDVMSNEPNPGPEWNPTDWMARLDTISGQLSTLQSWTGLSN